MAKFSVGWEIVVRLINRLLSKNWSVSTQSTTVDLSG